MLTPDNTNLVRFYEVVKLVLKDNLCYDFLNYILRGKPIRFHNGLELRRQSTIYGRLAHLYTKSSEFIISRYLSKNNLMRSLKLLGLESASFINDHFCCKVRDSILCSPKDYALSLAYQVRQIFLRKVYGSPTKSLVIDFGAWVGDSTIYFAKLGNYVIAVEPLRENTKYILFNAKLNNVEDKIKIINAAYPLTLFKDKCLKFNGPATTIPFGLNNISYVKFSEIISKEENKIYIKADCEGCEYDLVDEIIPKYVNIVYGIAMEIHKEVGDHFKLLNKLSKYYKLEYVANDDYTMVVRSYRKRIY